ncbi:MAG: DUF4173 domain-containing protein, partial [Treponema sp.]|nr:DUF4173 domain-containing protein [Treponema sp.]
MSEENMADKENLESIWNKEATACAEQEFWKNTEEDENVRNGRVKLFKFLFLPSLVLGLTCTLLLYGNYSSITMPLFIISCIAYCCHIMKSAAIDKLKQGSIFCFAVMLLLALSDCLTDNAFIINCNNIGICLVLIVALLHNFCDDEHWQLSSYFSGMLRCMAGTVSSIGDAIKDLLCWKKATNNKNKTVLYVFAGAIISAPVLALVTALLCSADRRYASLLNNIVIHIKFAAALRVCFFTIAAITCSYCTSRFLLKRSIQSQVKERRQFPKAVALTILSRFCVIYISFVYCQFLPQEIDRILYSEVAREGFFQLLAVSVINVLIVQSVLTHFNDSTALKALLCVFCACTYAMIASAAIRMFNYIGYYEKLTFLRVLVLWTLAVLSLLLAGQIAQLFSRRFPLFRYGFVTVCVCYLILSLARPEYWIASYNLPRMEQDVTKLDYRDIVDLERLARKTSCDAAPAFDRYGW